MATKGCVVVIPARMTSTRLPGKPLADICGQSLIERVYRQAEKIKLASQVIVATDDLSIVKEIKRIGGEAIMTSADHPSGTDRVAEVAQNMDAEIIVNLQGDEPFIHAEPVDMAIEAMRKDKTLNCATLCTPIDKQEAGDKNVTCVVRDLQGNALYFSKLSIPHDRNGDSADIPLFKHLGIYIYRRDFLLQMASWPPTPLEKCEKLEQLRILEHGEKIACLITDHDSIGVDSPEDLERARKIVMANQHHNLGDN